MLVVFQCIVNQCATKMSQQDVEQSGSQYKSSTEQLHIKDEPETHKDMGTQGGSEQYLRFKRLNEEVMIKEEPIKQNKYYLELEPVEDEPNVDDELTDDTQVKSAIPTENVAVDQSELGSLEDVQEDKQFKCNICSEAFSMLAYLKTHSCTGKKPYKCIICNKDFKFASRLKYHIRTHTGEKPFNCDTCGNTFVNHDNLKIHIRTHTGEKLYKCKTCGKSFTQSNTLKYHIKSCGISKPRKIVSNETDFIYSHLFR